MSSQHEFAPATAGGGFPDPPVRRPATLTVAVRGAVTVAALSMTLAMVTAAVGVAPAAQATGPARLLPVTGQAVADSYIVVLAKPADKTSAARLSAAHRAEVTHAYGHVLNGFAARMTQADAEALSRDPAVRYVQQDGYVSADAGQFKPASWGLNRIDQRGLPLDDYYMYREWGAGAHAYVLDTGIMADHADFGSRANVSRDFVGDGRGGVDCNGHGTHVAGTVGGSKAGVAKGVRLHALRVLNCDGAGQLSWIIAGMDWVVANAQRPAVVNMSLGSARHQATDDAVRRLVAAGIPVVVSAGNSAADACNASPAGTPEAITVASSNRQDTRSRFSSFGPCVDLFAPGEDITSAWHTHRAATKTISGTSMSAPHVTGMVARILGRSPTMTPAQVATELAQTATANVVSQPGPGSPNLLLWGPSA